MNLSQILPRLFVGACPTSVADINHLQAEQGISAILSLQTDYDLDYCDLDWNRLQARCQELGIVLRRIPIRDFDGEDLREKLVQCVQSLEELMSEGHTVYLHCNLGVGRSPSVAIAYLYWKQKWDLDEAVEHVTRCRSCSPNIEAIVLADSDHIAAA
jgi:protein-tyrosine phosphatase